MGLSTMHPSGDHNRLSLSWLAACCAAALASAMGTSEAKARTYFFASNPYAYADPVSTTVQTGTLSGYFNYNSSITNDLTTTPSPYGSAELTLSKSATSSNNEETYNNWSFYAVSSTHTRIVFWNNTNSVQLTLSSPLNDLVSYYSLTNDSNANRICSNKPTVFTTSGAASQYACQPPGTIRADMTFTGNTNIVPGHLSLLALAPLAGIARRVRARKPGSRLASRA